MAGFGDYSSSYQRGGVIPSGGMRIETGCYTQCADTTLYIPTQFSELYSLIVNFDTTGVCSAIVDISSGYIKATLANTVERINYVAFGF